MKIVTNLAQETGQIVLVNTAKTIATRFPRSAISSALPAAAEVIQIQCNYILC